MSRRLLAPGIALALASALGVASATGGPSQELRPRDERELTAAVSVLLDTGGTIRLRPRRYGTLVVPRRPSTSPRLHVGARRADGYAGSLRMSGHYRLLPKRVRPVVANNVIALLESRFPVCTTRGTFVANVVARGRRCSRSDHFGRPQVDALGRPTSRSTLLVDRAARGFAPPLDADGRRRGPRPDVGAYEYRAPG